MTRWSTSVRKGVRLSIEQGVGWVGDICRSVASLRARLIAPEFTNEVSTDLPGKVSGLLPEEFPGVLPGALPGVGYLECFGMGRGQEAGIHRLESQLNQLNTLEGRQTLLGSTQRSGVVVGIQPHAPYSASRAVYEAAVRLSQTYGYRLATHLAESQQELELIRDATGPFVDLLSGLDKWDNSIRATGLHPVEWLAEMLGDMQVSNLNSAQPGSVTHDESHQSRQLDDGHRDHMVPMAGYGYTRTTWLLAHCNLLENGHIDRLASLDASVAYCPVATDYFGHTNDGQEARGLETGSFIGGRSNRHRYRELIAAGVNVCLGTDSILCQPADEPQPLSILGQMRYLYRRDATDPDLLLRMATVNGLRGMGFDPLDATLQAGSVSRLVAVPIDPGKRVDPLVQALSGNSRIKPIH